MTGGTREAVLREFGAPAESRSNKAMADEIVRLRAALAAAPRVTVLDWRVVVAPEGRIVSKWYDNAERAQRFADEQTDFGEGIYRVARVALLDEPTQEGEG